MYAIIEDSGTQIKVSEGDVIKVAIRDLPTDAGTITFDRVLMVGGTDAAAKVGEPLLAGATVVADVIKQDKTDRVEIFKVRRRKNYRRHRSHRQDFLEVKVTAIKA